MDQLFGSLERLESRLADADVEWAVIGGLAVAVWGEPRLTRDVDVKVAIKRHQATEVLKALGEQYTPIHEIETAASMGVLFFEDSDGTRIDIMLSDLAFDEEAIARAKRVAIGSANPRVCTPEDLIIYKLLSTRPRDHADAVSVSRRQGKSLDREYVRGWLRDFELALDDSTLVETFENL